MIGYYHHHYILANRELISMMHLCKNRWELKSPLQNFWSNMHTFGECVKG